MFGSDTKRSWIPKMNYPTAIFFIIGNEFCERFSFYGMQAVLSIYLTSKLHYSEDTATVIYHAFSFFAFFSPILGAWLADQYFGKFKTIVWISLIYILGHVLKTLAAVPDLGVPPIEFSLIGLALIALGTGGIKPCVSSFGGDQFKLPEQEKQLKTYFSVFYFAINCGSLLSTFITPILRQDVKCFGEDSCFSLAFGVPAALMLIATAILVAGKPLYIFKPPQGNITSQVCGGIWFAFCKKIRSSVKMEHWLDAAKEKYDSKLVEDIKILLRVFVLYLPLPVFWALFKQQGSRWTFQATRMNGDIGSYTIKPDQMPVTNPLLVILFIPLFESVVYPLFKKINFLVKPLHRIVAGGLLAALAFFISGILELELQKTYAHVPAAGESHLNLVNTLDCQLAAKLNSSGIEEMIQLNASSNHLSFGLKSGQDFDLTIRVDDEKCANHFIDNESVTYRFNATSKHVHGIFVLPSEQGFWLHEAQIDEDPNKSPKAQPKFRFLFAVRSGDNQTAILKPHKESGKSVTVQTILIENEVSESNYTIADPGHYDIHYVTESNETIKIGSTSLLQGGVYTIAVSKNGTSAQPEARIFKLTSENSVHILWLVPQYFVITVGEIFFSVTGLEFSYSQAPATMKAVVQAAWLLTIAFGNLIVIIVAETKSRSLDQASEFFMFGTLMVVDMMIFAFMAYRYTFANHKHNDNNTSNEENNVKDDIKKEKVDNNVEMLERNGVEHKTKL